MAAWGYKFYLLLLKVYRSLLAALEDKICIPAQPCNILCTINGILVMWKFLHKIFHGNFVQDFM